MGELHWRDDEAAQVLAGESADDQFIAALRMVIREACKSGELHSSDSFRETWDELELKPDERPLAVRVKTADIRAERFRRVERGLEIYRIPRAACLNWARKKGIDISHLKKERYRSGLPKLDDKYQVMLFVRMRTLKINERERAADNYLLKVKGVGMGADNFKLAKDALLEKGILERRSAGGGIRLKKKYYDVPLDEFSKVYSLDDLSAGWIKESQ